MPRDREFSVARRPHHCHLLRCGAPIGLRQRSEAGVDLRGATAQRVCRCFHRTRRLLHPLLQVGNVGSKCYGDVICHVYPDSLKIRQKFLAFFGWADSDARVIQSGFLTKEDREKLIAITRDGSLVHRFARQANALVLLDKGWNCLQVAHGFLLDDDTIRGWRKLFEDRGIEGITSIDVGASASYLSVKQENDLKAWACAALPRSTRQTGAWIEREFGRVYESRSRLIAQLHRLGLEYRKPAGCMAPAAY
ncbi:MAG: helix-turn-helix domain-containing protein [Methylocella sp.]